ncbi:MAG: 30S ribosomal protein S14 [Candidatus Thermoplasmatota archaeon]|jgi:small subunit ribosomal protein S14|nr:30S ribosomal protein S14 [Candidatus Thermoplasmatota archaeon]
MSQIKLQPKKKFGKIDGCLRCGRKRGLVRRYGIRLCRQCFREHAPEIGFRKYS